MKTLYNYHDPVDISQFVMGDAVLSELVATPAFRRLKDVSFLGGIDYVLSNRPRRKRERYNRHQHSLGVARLSSLYAQEVGISYEERRLVCISALLHDIGHAPLSHSLEKVFFKNFKIEHHLATEDIIAGRVHIGQDVFKILKWHNVDIERVISIINGEEDSFYGFFAGPVNFDTIEGILRTYSYVNTKAPNITPDQVVKSAIFRSLPESRGIVDEFWMYKDVVYNTIINSDYGILADKICQIYMERNIKLFDRSDYFISEVVLFKKIPDLKRKLNDTRFLLEAHKSVEYPIEFNQRRFIVDKSVAFTPDKDSLRYRQTKVRRLATQPHSKSYDAHDLRDLFDDDGL